MVVATHPPAPHFHVQVQISASVTNTVLFLLQGTSSHHSLPRRVLPDTEAGLSTDAKAAADLLSLHTPLPWPWLSHAGSHLLTGHEKVHVQGVRANTDHNFTASPRRSRGAFVGGCVALGGFCLLHGRCLLVANGMTRKQLGPLRFRRGSPVSRSAPSHPWERGQHGKMRQ